MEIDNSLEDFLEDLAVFYREMPEKASELIRHFEKIASEKRIKSQWTSLVGQRLTFQKVTNYFIILDSFFNPKVIQSELSLAFPTSKSFTKRFLKFYLNLVDEERQPLDEELFEYYSGLLYSERYLKAS